ncbi:MAG: DUF427 domain-containing protein [Bacteroidota bacterium]
MPRPRPEKPAPGQESVWKYPRPPRLEAVPETLRVVFNGEEVAKTTRGYRVLETSHPPVYYFPPEDIKMTYLRRYPRPSSHCEWKGAAHYYDLVVGDRQSRQAAWAYADPTPGFAPIEGYLAFYAGRVDACFVNEEEAEPQPGEFYGGWITSKVVGPFKGEPGSWGW